MASLLITLRGSSASSDERATVIAPPAAEWPFRYPLSFDLPDAPSVLLVENLHDAFVNQQTAGTRLVTTQPGYWMVMLADLINGYDVTIRATADEESVQRHAPEVLNRKGIFTNLEITALTAPNAPDSAGEPVSELRRDLADRPSGRAGGPSANRLLISAFRGSDPRERLALCIQALASGRTPGALVATASVCMEVNDLDAAARDLDEAIEHAPDWAPAHYERGKVWLRLDDMERASASFRLAADRLPSFGPAWANLGATLGELDRPADALDAFTHALACDPSSAQTHNNIGVVSRELGRLAESEAAFRRVVGLAPELAFGYYNLGHTLFLQGRYHAALGAYAEGQKRDVERNPVQASRLAMCRLATGDAAGAISELQRATSALPSDYRRQLLADTHSIAWALLTHRPDLPGWQQVHDWLTCEQAR